MTAFSARMPFEDLQQKIQVLEDFDIVKETIEIINENSEYLSDLLAQQLSIGRDGKNAPVTLTRRKGVFDFYSDLTISNKERFGSGLGSVTSYITNYMTGAFYRQMFVKTEGTNFFIESSVPYFSKIIRQSGEVIMELNEEHLAMFTNNILIPQLQERFTIRWNGL